MDLILSQSQHSHDSCKVGMLIYFLINTSSWMIICHAYRDRAVDCGAAGIFYLAGVLLCFDSNLSQEPKMSQRIMNKI